MVMIDPNFVPAKENPHRITCWTTHDPNQEKYTTDAYGNLTRPEGWGLWCEHAIEARHPWDPDNTDGWVVPEVKIAEVKPDGSPQYPNRWYNGHRSVQFFSSWRTSRGGLYKTIDVDLRGKYTFSVQVHGWSNNGENNHDPHYSSGVGTGGYAAKFSEDLPDELKSIVFKVGIDPLGGINPFADTVVWSDPWVVYNEFHEISVTATAFGRITLFVWAENRWRNIHNDRYIAYPRLEVVGEEPPPEPPVSHGGYAYPVITHGSKLGIHAIGESGALDLLMSGAKPPIVKLLSPNDDDLIWDASVKAIHPDAIVIARIMNVRNSNINIEGPDFSSDPQRYMDVLLPFMQAHKDVDYWELWNEQDPPGVEGHVQMARFAVGCMKIAEQHGIKLALMSYSTGVPEFEEWLAIANQTTFFETAVAGKHILSLHAYGNTDNPGDVEYQLLRHEKLYNEILIPRNLVIPFVLTEYSIHESAPGVGYGDWDVERLIHDFSIMDDMLREEYYSLGAALFTFGGGVMGWPHYNLDPMWQSVADVIKGKQGKPNALPPTPDQDGFDSTVMVVDYQRILDEETRQRFYMEACKRGIYVGPSHDEAANWPKGAKSRTVELIGFDESDVDYIKWYEDHDPRIRLVFRPLQQDAKVGIFSQRDPAWADIELGTSGMTMAKIGCAVTACASIAHIVKPLMDPRRMVMCLNRNGGFTSDGRLYWKTVEKCVPELQFVYYGAVSVERLAEDLEEFPVIVKVDFKQDAGIQSHFVVATKMLDGDVEIMDPWDGTMTTLMARYSRGDLASSILAAAIYKPSPTVVGVRGAHDSPVYTPPQDIPSFVSRAKSLNLGWYKLLHVGDGNMVNFAHQLIEAGVEPVVRLYHSGVGRNPNIGAAQAMIDVGVKYFEVMNEPNIEWPGIDWHNANDVDAVASAWWGDAMQIINMGGRAAIPAMAPTDRGAVNNRLSGVTWLEHIVDWAMKHHPGEFVSHLSAGSLWLAIHISPFNKPFDYNPVRTDYIDDFCLLYGEVAAEMIIDRTGVDPFVISTEGGVYSPKHMVDLTFPVENGWVLDDSGHRLYNDDSWGDYLVQMFDFLASRDRKIPVCCWTFSDERVQDQRWLGCGWYDANGNPRSPVGALLWSA